MTAWLSQAAAPTNAEYHNPRIREFHSSVLRAFHGMQRSQQCVEVRLNRTTFPCLHAGDASRVFMCRVADNMSPRIWTQDRELLLRYISPHLLGVDPQHGGLWLSQPLVDTFLYGLDDELIPITQYRCPKALTGSCPGKKTVCTTLKEPAKEPV